MAAVTEELDVVVSDASYVAPAAVVAGRSYTADETLPSAVAGT